MRPGLNLLLAMLLTATLASVAAIASADAAGASCEKKEADFNAKTKRFKSRCGSTAKIMRAPNACINLANAVKVIGLSFSNCKKKAELAKKKALEKKRLVQTPSPPAIGFTGNWNDKQEKLFDRRLRGLKNSDIRRWMATTT